jgi:hypothetical protein
MSSQVGSADGVGQTVEVKTRRGGGVEHNRKKKSHDLADTVARLEAGL